MTIGCGCFLRMPSGVGGGAASLQLTDLYIPIKYVAMNLFNLSCCLHLLSFQRPMLQPCLQLRSHCYNENPLRQLVRSTCNRLASRAPFALSIAFLTKLRKTLSPLSAEPVRAISSNTLFARSSRGVNLTTLVCTHDSADSYDCDIICYHHN